MLSSTRSRSRIGLRSVPVPYPHPEIDRARRQVLQPASPGCHWEVALNFVVTLQSDSDIVGVISEVVVLEQILIRNLPAGTKAALRARAKQRHRSVEAEAREVLTKALEGEPVTIVDLLGTDEGADIEFEPDRLGLTARSAQL
jgi:antitoxin FitA